MAGSNDVRTSYIPCPTTAKFLNSVIKKPQPYFLRLGSAVPFVHHALWMAINQMKQGRFFLLTVYVVYLQNGFLHVLWMHGTDIA